MSVTFTFGSWVEDPGHGTVLMHGADHIHQCDQPRWCEDARIYFGYCDHAEAAEKACGCRAFDVNVSNANAMLLLERLGLPADPEDLVGDITGDDLLGRATVGEVGFDDSGDPDVVDSAPGKATFIDCGHRPGYFGDRLTRLAVLATEAKSRGLLVVWS